MIIGAYLNRFTFGEISPLLQARGELTKYSAGCKELVNFIPLLQGPVQRRGGTRHIAASGNGANPVALIRFMRDENDSFVIEAGDGYLRFYKNGAQVTNEDGTPYQIVSPWAQADLFNAYGVCSLKYVQSADVIFVVCPGQAPQKLMRYGDMDWRIEALGGWGDRPNANAVTLWRERLCLAYGNKLHMSQSGAFESFDVSVRAVPKATGTAAGITRVINAAEGSVSYTTSTGESVVIGWPVDEATVTASGTYGFKLTPTDAKKGISRVGFIATGSVQGSTGVDPYWKVAANSLNGEIRASRSNVYVNLSVDPQATSIYTDGAVSVSDGTVRGYIVRGAETAIAADDPIELDVYSDSTDDIEWLCPSNKLLVGTSSEELIVGETTTADPFGPENCKVTPETAFGSSPIQPLRVGSVVLFVQRSGRKLREFIYDYTGDNYVAMDLTVAAEHMSRGGLLSLAWQSEPIETLWATRPDGQLIGFTYSKDQDMAAWHRHQMGGNGAVSQIAVIPAVYGGRDELWLSVKRTINGQTVYDIEKMEHGHEYGEDNAESFFVDSGVTLRAPEGGGDITQVTGLDHLEGETVDILADGAVQPVAVVTGGAVALKYPARVVHAGLPYVSHLTTVNIEIPMQDGTGQGRIKRIVAAVLRIVDSLGGAAGHDLNRLERLEFRHGNDAMDTPIPLKNEDVKVNWPHGYELEGQLTVAQEYPLPFTLAAVIAETAMEGRN